jgi:uncharacterized membrane protein YkvA (DUF1232 family)
MLRSIIDQVWLTWKLLFDPRVPFWMKGVALAPIVYVLSPIDLIPDVVLGLGQLDDLGIVLAGMRLFEAIAPAYIVEEYRSAIKAKNDENIVSGRNYTVRQVNGDKTKREETR